jgi:hypothetical protein
MVVDADSPDSGPDPRAKKSSTHIEFFWLCEECAPEMTLIFKSGVGVTTQPLSRVAVAS